MSFSKITAVALLAAGAVRGHDLAQYHGQTILRTTAVGTIHSLLTNNEKALDSSTLIDMLGVVEGGTAAHVRANPQGQALLRNLGVEYDVVHPNVTALVEAEQLHMKAHKNSGFFTTYRTNDELLYFYGNLSEAHPDIFTFGPGKGKSIEGRDIYLGKISTGAQSTKKLRSEGKPVYFLGAAMHAREWISPMTLAYMISTLLEQYTVLVRCHHRKCTVGLPHSLSLSPRTTVST